MITLDNYEEYMMMYADGELQPQEEQALQAFLALHPQLQREMDLYQSAKLVPDVSQVYSQKDGLLKPIAESKIIAIPRFRAYGIAAGIAAIIVCSVFALRNYNNTDNQVALIVPHDTAAVTQHVANVNTVAATKSADSGSVINCNPVARTVNEQGRKNEKSTVHNSIINKKENTGIAVIQKNKRDKQHTDIPVEKSLSAQPEYMASLAPIKLQQLPVEKVNPGSQPKASLAIYAVTTIDNDAANRSWIDILPIDEDKKKNLNIATTAIVARCEKINEFKESITRRSLSLRIEHKSLLVSF